MALITSTMKSDPGRSAVRISTLEAGASSLAITAAVADRGGAGSCAFVTAGVAARVAAPATAPFRKLRRSTELFLDFDTTPPPTDHIIRSTKTKLLPVRIHRHGNVIAEGR